MKKFKIEYNPDWKVYRFVIYRKHKGWFKNSWERIASFETEEEAKTELEILVMFPKYFEGDAVDGIYNKE